MAEKCSHPKEKLGPKQSYEWHVTSYYWIRICRCGHKVIADRLTGGELRSRKLT